MPISRDCDIAIAGGSIVGLTLGVTLARVFDGALEVRILERDEAQAPHPAQALAISAGAKRLLEAIGLWRHVAHVAQPVVGVDITDSALDDAFRPLLLTYDTELEGREPGLYIVPARALHRAARTELATAPALTFEAPASVSGLALELTSVRLRLADGRQRVAGLAVATDGRSSTLRAAAGIKTIAWSYGQTGIVAIVGHERPHRGRAVQHFLPAGPFAILPLVDNRACVTWSEETAEASRILALDRTGFLAELERRFGHRLGQLELLEGPASWPLGFQMARELHAPRLVLAGDAARGVHPIAGQGLNLGLRDVAALVECLVDGLRVGLDVADATILERYARWRRFDSVTSATAYGALNALFSQDDGLLRALRDAGLQVVNRMAGLKRLIVEEAAGLTGDVPKLLRGELPRL